MPAAAKSFRPPVDERTVAPETVRLVRADVADRDVLANLMQLYRHDLAEFRGYTLGEDGTYAYPYLDANLAEPDREVYLIRAEESLVGFTTLRRLPDGAWQVSEFFVDRPYRRRGVGRIALDKAIGLHRGTWTCFVDQLNDTSLRMCSNVATEASGQDPETRTGVSALGFAGTVLRFDVPEPPAAEAAASEPATTGC
ncbi:GNAT family N-acetyltransferase [soil metagenome]